MKRYAVTLSARAEEDLIQVYQWVFEAAGEAVADRLYDRLRSAAQSLQYFPERGVLRPNIASDARLLISGNHLILYRIDVSAVDIMRIVYGSVDLTDVLV